MHWYDVFEADNVGCLVVTNISEMNESLLSNRSFMTIEGRSRHSLLWYCRYHDKLELNFHPIVKQFAHS